MQLNQYLEALRDDLLAAAALGDEDARRSATLLTTALEPAARLMLISALSDFAAEVSTHLGDVTIDVTLRGRDVHVGVREHDSHAAPFDWAAYDATADSHAESGSDDMANDTDLGRAMREAGDELSRTTLRLVNRLKSQAEQAATVQGVSLNTYIQRAVADAVRAAGRRAKRGTGGTP